MSEKAVACAILLGLALLLGFVAFSDYNARVFGIACVESGGHYIRGQCVQPGELCEERR